MGLSSKTVYDFDSILPIALIFVPIQFCMGAQQGPIEIGGYGIQFCMGTFFKFLFLIGTIFLLALFHNFLCHIEDVIIVDQKTSI